MWRIFTRKCKLKKTNKTTIRIEKSRKIGKPKKFIIFKKETQWKKTIVKAHCAVVKIFVKEAMERTDCIKRKKAIQSRLKLLIKKNT